MKKMYPIVFLTIVVGSLSFFGSTIVAAEKSEPAATGQNIASSDEKSNDKNNFIITKKKQRPSSSRLKEEIGEGYERMLKKQATIIERMAQANKMLVDRTRELLDDECCATTAQLQQHKEKLETIEKTLNKFESDSCSMLDCFYAGLPVKGAKNQNKKDLAVA